jgi:hypothetical protein
VDVCGLPRLLALTDCLLNPETNRGARDPTLACLAYLVATNISSMKEDSLGFTPLVFVGYEPELLLLFLKIPIDHSLEITTAHVDLR